MVDSRKNAELNETCLGEELFANLRSTASNSLDYYSVVFLLHPVLPPSLERTLSI